MRQTRCVAITSMPIEDVSCDRYKTSKPVTAPLPIYEAVSKAITQDERGLLAMVVYREARGESYDGQKAVVEVVLNRVKSAVFPNTIFDVVYADGQFSCASDLTTKSVTELGSLATAMDAVDEVLSETAYVTGSDFLYFNTKPYQKLKQVKIGNHYFGMA